MNETIRDIAIKELGMSDLPSDMQNEIFAQVGENIMRGVAIAALEKLSPEDQAEFERIAEEGDAGKTQQFLSSKIPDFETFTANEAKKVIAEIKQATEEM